MGVNNVNNANKANIIKFALNKKSAQNTQSYKPEYLKMTGSIFNAKTPETKDPRRDELTELNARHSLGELKPPVSGGKKKLGEDSFKDVDDVSSGKAAISTGRSTTNDVEAQTARTEKDARFVKSLSKSADKLGDSIKDGDKKFLSKLKTDQKAFDKDNAKIQKLVKESEENQKVIDDAQHELDALLLASNSFQMGGTDGNNSNPKNSGRINELQTLIGSKVGMMQKNGKAIYSLQRSQSKTLSRMNKTNKAYINTQKTNQKNIKSQQAQNNSVIDVAQQIEQYSAMAQAGGQALGLAGDALIALGQGLASTLFGSAAGAAMVSVGTVMKKVGSGLELVGQYGQTAANLTKTAAYAAEGNIMGAMMNCQAAIQSGTAAVKSTGNIGKEWKNIDAQANAAKQNIAAKDAAKDAVDKKLQEYASNNKFDVNNLTKDQKKAALDGMTQKEAYKATRNNLRNQMAKNENLTQFSDMQDFANNNAGDSLDTSMNNFTKNREDALKGLTFKDGHYEKTITGKNGKTKTIKYSENDIHKIAKDKTIEGLSDKAKVGINWDSNLQKLGGSAMTIASVFMRNQAMNEMSNPPKKHLEQFQMDARTQRIMARNQRYRRHASYV